MFCSDSFSVDRTGSLVNRQQESIIKIFFNVITVAYRSSKRDIFMMIIDGFDN